VCAGASCRERSDLPPFSRPCFESRVDSHPAVGERRTDGLDPHHERVTILAHGRPYPNQVLTASHKFAKSIRTAIVHALVSPPAKEQAMMRLRKCFVRGRSPLVGHVRQCQDVGPDWRLLAFDALETRARRIKAAVHWRCTPFNYWT
jgi:hypothetical protein